MDFSKLQAGSKVTNEWAYPLKAANRTGFLQVDHAPNHTLYWEEYGNPDGEPVMFLHGGPGGGCAPEMSRFFDPARYRVILFDQRGCGKSEPTVANAGPAIALTKNTTDHLIDDINKLRDALGITGKMHVFGGSWGSTLALVYGIRWPQYTASLILRGIFLVGQDDLDFMYQGNAATFATAPHGLTEPGTYIHFPDEWRAFVERVPSEQRGDMRAAYKAIFDMTPATEAERQMQTAAAVAWSVWEGSISNLVPVPRAAGLFGNEAFALCFAQIEAHFFAHNCFIPPHYILDNAPTLATLPVHIVHGRYDVVCPPTQASSLKDALTAAGGPPASFILTTAGHSAMEGQNVLALTAIMDGLPTGLAG
jgi:proline iminopeptidase